MVTGFLNVGFKCNCSTTERSKTASAMSGITNYA